MTYDSTRDTEDHITEVRRRLQTAADELILRGGAHDRSKLFPPEKELYDKVSPKLKDMEFGSEEYKQSLEELGPALEHHYANNSHHPQHYENGIAGMDLIDLVEMYCDWAAAALRSKNGDLEKGIEISIERFGITGPLAEILRNTFVRHGGFVGYKDYCKAGQQTQKTDPAWTEIYDNVFGMTFARRPKENVKISDSGDME